MDSVTHLANRYNGIWTTAMQCAWHAIPAINWDEIEKAYGRWVLEVQVDGEVVDFGVTEDDIANADPRAEFEEPKD